MAEKKEASLSLSVIGLGIGVIVILGLLYFLYNQNGELQSIKNKSTDLETQLTAQKSELNTAQAELASARGDVQSKVSQLAQVTSSLDKEQKMGDAFRSYSRYGVRYSGDMAALNDKFSTTNNITLDYASCMERVNLLREEHKEFADNEQVRLDFYNKVAAYANKTSCNEKIDIYKNKLDKAQADRTKYDDTFETWCYGYHKTTDSGPAWYEQYETPLDNINADLTASEKTASDAENDVILTCMS